MIIIGEKINGTIPATGAAIAAHDSDAIKALALAQAEAGSSYIDVCAGVSPEQEVETLRWLIDCVQSVTDVPISLDSSNPRSILAVMPDVNKPGLINSVSMEGDKTDVIFPVIADTEWECVALLCGDGGIPSTVEERLTIARALLDKAAFCGIAPSRLHIDPLVIALSTDGQSMSKFMECTRTLKEWHPEMHVTSGLSNISFGLPVRRSINQSFLTLAMSAGMDSAIMDPTNREMLAALLSTDALLEHDRFCRKYNTAYRKGKIGNKPQN